MHNKTTFLVQSIQSTHKKPMFRVRRLKALYTKLQKRVVVFILENTTEHDATVGDIQFGGAEL